MGGTFLGREPAAIAAFLAIVVNLAITFGLNLTADQVALINALVVAGLALLVRQSSTPNAAPVIAAGTSVTVSTPSGQPNGTATLTVDKAGEVTAS